MTTGKRRRKDSNDGQVPTIWSSPTHDPRKGSLNDSKAHTAQTENCWCNPITICSSTLAGEAIVLHRTKAEAH